MDGGNFFFSLQEVLYYEKKIFLPQKCKERRKTTKCEEQ